MGFCTNVSLAIAKDSIIKSAVILALIELYQLSPTDWGWGEMFISVLKLAQKVALSVNFNHIWLTNTLDRC